MKLKYELEMSEAEYLGGLSMVEHMFDKMVSVLVTVSESKDHSYDNDASIPAPIPVSEWGKHHYGPPHTPDDTSAAASYWGPEDIHAVRFDDHYGADRPDGTDVARGDTDDRGLPPREEAPLPKVAQVRGQDLDRGRKAFEKLLRLWIENFGVEDAPQPDRAEAMRVVANGKKAFALLAYVKSQGGLTHAVNALLSEIVPLVVAEGMYQQTVLDVAGNMTQVASILFPDLSDLYEYKNIFRSGEDEEDEDDE